MADKEIRAHALLSASGAHRWLNCTPSARLEEKYGLASTSKYADEGTLAHAIGELMLRRDLLDSIADVQYEKEIEELMNHPAFNEEMFDEVPKYVDYCIEQFTAAKTITPDAIDLVEEKIDLTAYIPDGFGSCDNIIIADGTMEVIDLKYGKGVPVSATGNKQLMLYGLGALHRYGFTYDIHTIKLTVFQPRIDNVSSWEISAAELMNWAETELREKANLAHDGKGTIAAGDWCKFCKVKNRCRVLAEENMKMARFDFADAALLSDDEIANILARTPLLVEWANSIHEYATNLAITTGKEWPGYKLVEGQSRRKWVDEDTVAKVIFSKCPNLEENDLFKSKLKSITEIEKLVGKAFFAQSLSDTFIKPPGALTLVSLSSKKAPVKGSAKNDFND